MVATFMSEWSSYIWGILVMSKGGIKHVWQTDGTVAVEAKGEGEQPAGGDEGK